MGKMKNKKSPTKQDLVDNKIISVPMVSSPSSGGKRLPARRTNASTAIKSTTESVSTTALSNNPGGEQVNSASLIRDNDHETKTQICGRDPGDSTPQKRQMLIKKQLQILLHTMLCRVREELRENVKDKARQCSTLHCGLFKNVLAHLLTCENHTNCTYYLCLSSRHVLRHWKTCTRNECPVCSSCRRAVSSYFNSVLPHPRSRKAILNRLPWIINLMGPIDD